MFEGFDSFWIFLPQGSLIRCALHTRVVRTTSQSHGRIAYLSSEPMYCKPFERDIVNHEDQWLRQVTRIAKCANLALLSHVGGVYIYPLDSTVPGYRS